MRQFRSDAGEFPVVDSGPQDAAGADTVILLHGFPQTSAAWARVTPALVAAGLRTLAPDTRGTAPAARPGRRRDFTMDHLVADVLALADAAGAATFHLAGHDWGAGIAWSLATRHPDRVLSLTALSVPHPAALAWAVRHADQGRRSSYMLPMQVPVVPERLGAALVARGALRRLGLPAEQEALYRERFSDPAALAGALALYRGIPFTRREDRSVGDVEVPTTFVWGSRDPYLGRAAAERTRRHCHADYRFVELDADHWLPEKRSADVAREILARAGGERLTSR